MAQDRAGSTTEGDQGTCLEPLQPSDLGHARRAVLESDIHHLAADHAGMTRGMRQPRHEFAANKRIAVRLRRREKTKCECEKRVAGENRRGLVERLVCSRL